MTPKQRALRALEQMKSDDAERARRNFRGLSDDQMELEHGQSGKSRKQILSEYEQHERDCQDAIDWVNRQSAYIGSAMNLYLISQNTNRNYDTYDSAVVSAPDEETAKLMKPEDGSVVSLADWSSCKYSTWCRSPNDVQVELIGVAADHQQQGLILGSFNAG